MTKRRKVELSLKEKYVESIAEAICYLTRITLQLNSEIKSIVIELISKTF